MQARAAGGGGSRAIRYHVIARNSLVRRAERREARERGGACSEVSVLNHDSRRRREVTPVFTEASARRDRSSYGATHSHTMSGPGVVTTRRQPPVRRGGSRRSRRFVRPSGAVWVGGRIALGSGAAGGSAVEACGHALQGHRRRAPARPPEDGAVEACGDALQGHRRRAPARPPEGGAGGGGSAPRALRVREARAPTQARGSGRFISRARSLRKRAVASGLVKMSATFSSPGTNVVLSSFACTSSRT